MTKETFISWVKACAAQFGFAEDAREFLDGIRKHDQALADLHEAFYKSSDAVRDYCRRRLEKGGR